MDDALLEPWSREVINRAKVWKGDRVLDVACGTGLVACRIAGTGAKVTALEADAALIEQGKQRAIDESVPVTWMVGALPNPRVKPASFDLVTSFFAVPTAVLAREMRKAIAPGGRAVLACWADAIDRTELQKLLEGAKFFAVSVEEVARPTAKALLAVARVPT